MCVAWVSLSLHSCSLAPLGRTVRPSTQATGIPRHVYTHFIAALSPAGTWLARGETAINSKKKNKKSDQESSAPNALKRHPGSPSSCPGVGLAAGAGYRLLLGFFFYNSSFFPRSTLRLHNPLPSPSPKGRREKGMVMSGRGRPYYNRTTGRNTPFTNTNQSCSI